jgi:HK97 family phage major capsid protein
MNLKGLVEKKNDLITRYEEIVSAAEQNKRALTDDEAQELAEIRDNVRKIVETLKLDDDFRELDKMKVKEDAEPKEEVEVKTTEERAMETEKIEREQFENFIRGHVVHERAGELTPATTGTGIGLGGVLIPQTIVNHIIRKVYDICPILDRSQKFNVKGKLEVPYYPAGANTINVAYQTEFSPLASSSGSFATIELTGFLAGALTKVSRTLINNVDFDVVGFVVDEMSYAIKRFIEHELLIGTSGKVEGLSGATNIVTAGSATAITLNDIINLHDAIKDDFQSNAIWIMSPATRTALRELVSNTGYPLLNDDISTPFGTSILGKPVYVSDNMPDVATGVKAIYYGDMHGLATKFNENINVEVLRERYADEHAIGVIGWFEFDSKVIDNQQIAVLQMK